MLLAPVPMNVACAAPASSPLVSIGLAPMLWAGQKESRIVGQKGIATAFWPRFG